MFLADTMRFKVKVLNAGRYLRNGRNVLPDGSRKTYDSAQRWSLSEKWSAFASRAANCSNSGAQRWSLSEKLSVAAMAALASARRFGAQRWSLSEKWSERPIWAAPLRGSKT